MATPAELSEIPLKGFVPRREDGTLKPVFQVGEWWGEFAQDQWNELILSGKTNKDIYKMTLGEVREILNYDL